MKKRWFVCCLGALSLCLLPALALASGYGLNELGTKALGMGGAFAAQADDPSAVYFNPAGIVQLEGTQVSVGFNTVTPTTTFRSNGTSGIPGSFPGQETDLEDQTYFIPNAYVTHKISDKVSFGFAAFSNFGLATDWPDDWEGRYLLGGQKVEIQTFSLNPVIAYRPHKRISLAAGPVAQYFKLDVEYLQFVEWPPRNPLIPAQIGPVDVRTDLEGYDWNWGWNVALLVWITDNLKFGATYRSEINHNITGTAEFAPQIPPQSLAPLPVPGFPGILNTGVDTEITSPAIAYLALAYTHGPLTLEFDAQWTEWSTFESLTAVFEQPVLGQPGLSDEFNWEDTWAYRFGVQYSVLDWLDLRAGFVYDEKTVPDETLSPLLPSGDRQLYTFGASGHYKSFTVDFAYNYLVDEDRDWNNQKGDPTLLQAAAGVSRVTGEFKDGSAHIFGLNLTYRF
jgi:long-chain fatty acid transport protein